MDVPELTTERLRLRPLTVADAPAMAALLGDDHDAIQMTSHVPDPCTVDGARGWIELRSGPGSYPYAIEVGGEMVGVIGCLVEGTVAGMGYWVGRAHWGRGYATEAARALLRFVVTLGVHTVEADTFTGTAASVRVLEKAGFRYVDTVDEMQLMRGGLRQIDRFVWTDGERRRP